VTTGPLLATPLPQRQRVASAAPAGTTPAERTAPAEGGDIRDIAAMMDFLRREA
jgi:hypothetical protein